jgi:Uma2 family endonuclease
MSRLYQITKDADKWEFANEASLEDFVWDNLEQLLSLKPLRRQHHVNGNFCDILAVSENHQLVVIGLKNTEDRYVVQQLTRYYDALLREKPFEHQIDYDLPVSLTILSPSFHNAIAPDWTIEILSPDQSQTRVTKNILHCLKHGTQMGWLIDPDEQTVFVYLPKQRIQVFDEPENPSSCTQFCSRAKSDC